MKRTVTLKLSELYSFYALLLYQHEKYEIENDIHVENDFPDTH